MQIGEVKSYVSTTGGHIGEGWLAKLFLSIGITVLAQIFGVSSTMIAVLVMMSILDFITGLLRAKIKGEVISSSKAANTLFKGLMYACLIVASWGVSLIFNDYLPIHYLAVAFLMLVEFHSILENMVEAEIGLPPQMLDWVRKTLNMFKNEQRNPQE